MDRFPQEVTNEAHMRMLMHRDVRVAEHPRPLSQTKEGPAPATFRQGCHLLTIPVSWSNF
jgi:hypothetical protein